MYIARRHRDGEPALRFEMEWRLTSVFIFSTLLNAVVQARRSIPAAGYVRAISARMLHVHTFKNLYLEKLQDLYDVEQQMIMMLPGIIQEVSSQKLKLAFKEHLDVTEEQRPAPGSDHRENERERGH